MNLNKNKIIGIHYTGHYSELDSILLTVQIGNYTHHTTPHKTTPHTQHHTTHTTYPVGALIIRSRHTHIPEVWVFLIIRIYSILYIFFKLPVTDLWAFLLHKQCYTVVWKVIHGCIDNVLYLYFISDGRELIMHVTPSINCQQNVGDCMMSVKEKKT